MAAGAKRRIKRLALGLATSVLVGLPPATPVGAAEQLRLQLDGLELPVNLAELEAWSREPGRSGGDLAVWLHLLEPKSRRGLVRLLRAPLLRDRSFGLQLLGSWSGEQMLQEVGELLTTSQGRSTAAVLLSTLRNLLQHQQSVNAIELLRALPGPELVLRIDVVLELAQQWQGQLALQTRALQQLRRLELPRRDVRRLALGGGAVAAPRRHQLPVPHRSGPLAVEVWPSRDPAPGPWVLLMPGLGGDPDQLGWLAAALAERSWPVVVVEHPGSDGKAMRASLDGQRPPPGAESLPDRLADLQAVLAAQRNGSLGPLGPGQAGRQGVVLMGHSLGGLTALIAAGLQPERGLERRCRRALDRLPLTNLSRLLQCQIPQLEEWTTLRPDTDASPLLAVVAFNSFGGLLWPRDGLAPLRVPVLLVGGSLDLITPPISEQLPPFLQAINPRSRLVLVEGGSHFSPVRLARQRDALFRLGDELVGVEPRRVQSLLLNLTSEFLLSLREPLLLMPQQRQQEGITAWVLDRRQARQWWGSLPRRELVP
ncbi:MAG: alpha/beta hydrolase [Cyanobacteriota bacterium]